MEEIYQATGGWQPTAGEIEMLPIGLLRPRSDNPRTHSKRQIEKIAASIQRFGFTNPILIDEHNQVLAGHGRLAAVKTLWMDRVPCRRLANMSDDEKQAYLIADNKLGLEAGWDNALLADSFGALESFNFDLSLTGFDTAEIERALSQQQSESTRRTRTDEDDVPPTEETRVVSRAGDIWQLGRHRLACGDARDASVVGSLMNADLADLIFSDPPYNVPINGHVSGLGKVKHAEFEMASGEMSKSAFANFLGRTLGLAASHCRDGAIAFVCMDWRHIAALIEVGATVFSEFKNLCVWNKTNAGMGAFYRSKHELIGVFKIGDAPHTNTFGLGDKGRYRTNVWSYAGVNSFASDRMDQLERHPTSKPVAMVADAIRDVSYRGDIVLDMFGGSGTTLIAAQSTGRVARLVEIAPNYCDVIVRRWQDYTGKSATLEATDDTFEITQTSRQTEDSKNG